MPEPLSRFPSLSSLPGESDHAGMLRLEESSWFNGEVRTQEAALKAYIRRRFPSLSDVDDVVQESYLRILRARTAGGVKAARGFLFVAARNIALDLLRHRAVVPLEPLTENAASHVSTPEADAAEAASLSQDLEVLTEALAHLPERCRQVIMLRRIHGLSHKAIAERLGISEHTVEKQVGIGLKKCVAFLRNRGVER